MPENCEFRSINPPIDIMYAGDGARISRDFYIPVLRRAKKYDRLSGYFSLDSLTITATGLAGLISHDGTMRLVVGAHDVGRDLESAYELSIQHAQELIEEVGLRITEQIDSLVDFVATERLRALAWLLCTNKLEIRVAIPRRTFLHLGHGIFHEKLMIFEDVEGCRISAHGSANETRFAYEQNGESLWVHKSWEEGHTPFIDRLASRFQQLWNNQDPDYLVFPLPEAIERKLRERYYSLGPPRHDPYEREVDRQSQAIRRLVPAARLISTLGSLGGYLHLGLGPVILYPHQRFTADTILARYPYRGLLADEVGLGKTLEAGAIIKRLLDERQVERVLILAPKNVTRQWLDEMQFHFGIRFWLYQSGPEKSLTDSAGIKMLLSQEDSPYDYPGVDCLVMSWHYARTENQRNRILASERGFDLVVVDEAHAARKKRGAASYRPTLLNRLCNELSVANPHLLLLTATPVQVHTAEALDLLEILGLGGIWVHENNFTLFFDILRRDPGQVTEDNWVLALRMVHDFASRMLTNQEIDQLIGQIVPNDIQSNVRTMMRSGENFGTITSQFIGSDIQALRRFIMSLSPLQWLMVRNTRARLTRQGFVFPNRQTSEVAVSLTPEQSLLLNRLDTYLRTHYAGYERLISAQNRGTIGFVRCIYHQRFVSSFTAAHETIRNRLDFIDGLLQRDREAIERVSLKFFDEEDDIEEEDFEHLIEELLSRDDVERVIRREREELSHILALLAPYAPGRHGANDPKISGTFDTLASLLSDGRRVLVFSKYVDTVAALRGYILERGYPPDELAIYTGTGGELFDNQSGHYIGVSKEDVRRSLEDGIVRIVLCTDAASEGLNLQAASAVINIDMPWNPARVEQRIGRVDRLGQQAETVQVRNVWYPESIEAQMYRILFERRGIYQFVVGPAQEVFSEGLRRAFDLHAQGEELNRFVEATFQEIERIREQNADIEGIFSGQQWGGDDIIDDAVVHRLLIFIRQACEVLGLHLEENEECLFIQGIPSDLEPWNGMTMIAGRANALTPAHPILFWLCTEVNRRAGQEDVILPNSYYVLRDGRGIGTLYSIDHDGLMEEIGGNEVLDLLDQFLEETLV